MSRWSNLDESHKSAGCLPLIILVSAGVFCLVMAFSIFAKLERSLAPTQPPVGCTVTSEGICSDE